LRFEKKRERGKQKSMYYSQDLREVFHLVVIRPSSGA